MASRKMSPLAAGVLCVALTSIGFSAETEQVSMLLPTYLRISGVVVDASGNPIANALIQNTDEATKEIKTNANGEFTFVTRAPAFVIRKAGFRSVFLQSKSAAPVRVTMEISKEVPPFCAAQSACNAIDGWGSVFCFPIIRGVKVSKVESDIDYLEGFFTVRTKSRVKGIRYGIGPLWSDGIPSNLDVWNSVTYSEKTFSAGNHFIVDARGITATGKYWRYMGIIGESAAYSDVDQGTAILLDRVLDGMCIRILAR